MHADVSNSKVTDHPEFSRVVSLVDRDGTMFDGTKAVRVPKGSIGFVGKYIESARRFTVNFEVDGDCYTVDLAADELVAASPESRRECPCCGYRTLENPCSGSHEICPVCFWEDDPYQLAHSTSCTGANNGICLVQARASFAKMGACDARFIDLVRAPNETERAAYPSRIECDGHR